MSGRHYPFGDEDEGGEGPQWPDARQSRPRGDGSGSTGGDGRGGYGQSGPTSRRRSPEEGAYGEGAGGSRHSGGPTRGGYGPGSAGGRPGPSWGGGDAPTRPSGDGWGNYTGGGYGPSGGYGPPGSYGAPGSFSQPRPPGGSGGYGQAGPPSYGRYGGDPYAGAPPDDYGSPYGQSAPTSRGWNIVPDQGGYGGYDQRSQSTWGAQQEDWNAPAVPERRSRKKLWVTLGVVAALLLCSCGGLGVLAIQFFAPAATAGAFCGVLQAKAYTSAYDLMSKQAQSRMTAAQYAQDGQTLDYVQGALTHCGTANNGTNGYNYQLGGSKASIAFAMTRATAGALTGSVRLVNEAGAWKVDALDTSLLGVNLDALTTATSYCAAFVDAKYDAAFALLGAKAVGKTKVADYTQLAKWRDAVDGSVSTCAVTGFGSVNNETAASMTLSVARGTHAPKKGPLVLGVENNVWKISTAGPEQQGTDLGALQTAARFCADLASANYADVFGLLSATGKGGSTMADVAAAFSGTVNGIKWMSCTVDPAKFKVSGGSATLTTDVKLQQLSSGQVATAPINLKFAHSGAAWLLDDVAPHT